MSEYPLPSIDFIAGLVNRSGNFLWVKQKNQEVPVFQIKMELSEIELLEIIKEKLGLKEVIHQYTHQKRSYGLLLVRRRATIETIIIPIFDQRLFGSKKVQFEEWKTKYYTKKLEFVYKQHQR